MRKYTCHLKKMRPRLGFHRLYTAIGIDFTEVKKIQQIQANETTIKLMQDNIRKATKRDKEYKYLSPTHLSMTLGLEFLNYSPKTNNEVPDNEVWVYDVDDPNV